MICVGLWCGQWWSVIFRLTPYHANIFFAQKMLSAFKPAGYMYIQTHSRLILSQKQIQANAMNPKQTATKGAH